jgi:hypothetical protein
MLGLKNLQLVAKQRSCLKVLSSEIRDHARCHMPSHELQVCGVWLYNSILVHGKLTLALIFNRSQFDRLSNALHVGAGPDVLRPLTK